MRKKNVNLEEEEANTKKFLEKVPINRIFTVCTTNNIVK